MSIIYFCLAMAIIIFASSQGVNIGILTVNCYAFSMNREAIIKKLQEVLPIVQEKYHVKTLGIFGSVARGDDTEASDVDILVEFDEQAVIGLLGFVRLQKLLSDALGKEVDLVTKDGLKKVIKEDILRETIYV